MELKLQGFTNYEISIIHNTVNDYIKLMKAAADVKIKICNIPARSCPITCPKRMNVLQQEDYVIYLCHQPDYWCQMIYQLAHELGHFFMKCYPEKNNLKWISECLCEMCSIVFLHRSIEFFKIFSLEYVTAVQNYINDHLQKSLSYSALTCSELVANAIETLERDPTEDGIVGRPRNCYIAAKLFEAVGNDVSGMSAICLFEDLPQADAVKNFFNMWLEKCRSDDEKCFVQTIRGTLGI